MDEDKRTGQAAEDEPGLKRPEDEAKDLEVPPEAAEQLSGGIFKDTEYRFK